jgi:hypothetical protein
MVLSARLSLRSSAGDAARALRCQTRVASLGAVSGDESYTMLVTALALISQYDIVISK